MVPLNARRGEAHYQRAVLILSVGFFGVFAGFNGAQGLETSLNATLGDINLSALYGTFTVLCLVAPPVLAKLERCIGLRASMIGGAAIYAAMCYTNIVATPSDPAAIWAVPIVMNTLVGVAAPVLWTFQCDYVGRAAAHAALEKRDEGQEAVESAKAEMATRFNGLFFSYFQFAGMCGNIISSVILLSLSASDAVKDVLFVVLGTAAFLGALTFTMLPALDSVGGSEHPSVLDTARVAVSNARVGLLIPLMFVNGLTLSFFIGDFQAAITCPVLGPGFTGFVLACFYGVNSLASQLWSKAIRAGRISRFGAYIAATIFIAAYLVARLLWPVPAHYERDDSAEAGWRRVPGSPPASAVDIAMVFVLTFAFAVGDAFYESGPPATLQTFLAGTPDLVPALANYKLWQSLGQAAQFALSVGLAGMERVQCLVLLAGLGVGLVCVVLLNCRVAKLDHAPVSCTPAAAGSS